MGETKLGRMQFRIMQVLWDRGRANAREITEALNAPRRSRTARCRRSCGNWRPRGP